jgi:hypothetical protein
VCRPIADALCTASLTKCPKALLENALIRTEKLARRPGVEDIVWPPSLASVADAVAVMVDVARWAESLAGAQANPVAA